MKHLGLGAITVAAAAGALVGPGPLRANCGVISQRGIYDVSSSSSASDRALAYRAWFCQQNFSSASQANQVGLDIGYDSFELGFDQEKESWQQFYSSFCSDTSYDSRFRQQTETFTQRINERVVAALQACVTQRGLHAWIEQGVDGRSFVFRTVFVAASKSDNLPRVEAFNVIGATCQGALAKGARIGPDGTEMLCHRRSAATPVQIGFDATSFVNKDTPLGLAPVFRPPPPPKAEPLTIAAVSYVKGDGIAPNGPIILNNTNPNKDRPNMAEYRFRVSVPGPYNLNIEYAAQDPRPVQILVNGVMWRQSALNDSTDCWDCQKWVDLGRVDLRQGENTLRIQRDHVFPHIRTIRFTPVS